MKNNPQGWVLFGLALPAVIIGWLWLLVLCILFVAEWSSLRFQGAGVLTARTRKRAAKFWGYSTTVGHAILYHPLAYDDTPAVDNRTERHEFVHIKQWEDALAASFLGGAVVATVGWALLDMNAGQGIASWALIWCLGVAAMLPNFFTAVMRYGWKGIYRDTEHERSAYAQTDLIHQSIASWDQLRDEHRKVQEGLLG